MTIQSGHEMVWLHINIRENSGIEPSSRALLGLPKRQCLSPEGSACLPHSERLLNSSNWAGTTILWESKRKIVGFLHELDPGESPGAPDQDADNYIDWLFGFKHQIRLVIVENRSFKATRPFITCLVFFFFNIAEIKYFNQINAIFVVNSC